MPDRDVRTLQDLIWYQYGKIIAKRALGPEAKREHYGFVKKTLRDLQCGKKQWSDIAREDWQLVESEKGCVYCGSPDNLSREHLVPKTLRSQKEGGRLWPHRVKELFRITALGRTKAGGCNRWRSSPEWRDFEA